MAKNIPNLMSPQEVQQLLGRRSKQLRLQAGLKRETLARRSGVSARSLQRFEDTGEVSLKNLLRLVHSLRRLSEFAGLLSPPEAASLSELEARATKPTPKRGRI
jgi:transcriptional regulator with XRE-family HTH domain